MSLAQLSKCCTIKSTTPRFKKNRITVRQQWMYRVRKLWLYLCWWRCLTGQEIVQDGNVAAAASHQGPCERCTGSASPAPATTVVIRTTTLYVTVMRNKLNNKTVLHNQSINQFYSTYRRECDSCEQTEQRQRTPRQTKSALTGAQTKNTHTHNNRMILNNAIKIKHASILLVRILQNQCYLFDRW